MLSLVAFIAALSLLRRDIFYCASLAGKKEKSSTLRKSWASVENVFFTRAANNEAS
jgi:hypothetical protein